MAMTDAGMGAKMIAKVRAIPGLNIIDEAEFEAYHNALGAAVVEYIQQNAALSIPTGQTVTTPSGEGHNDEVWTGTVL